MTRRINQIDGTAIPLRGDNIDTDRIIPARYLKAITFEGLGDHVFEDDRRACANHPFSTPAFRSAAILLVNDNFGSGSSREHAPQALTHWGIRACIGQSFSEIFSGNSLTIGLPCATATPDAIEFLMQTVEQAPESRLMLSIDDLTVDAPERTVQIEMPAAMREALLRESWNATGLLLDRGDEVRAIANRLPYVRGF